ncbi:Lrp/AsnC family transcriptional regulator [Pseudonocardia acaciae]|uniref:Lrp/AsnC family transcriptional regulator n=1 Tax=Pseudonocardia acaciae TaxID=551276 RepID=UPI000684744F|nr:Lrp/AsnC family transcriptional regulator [Pseudonocardia acaciae]
MPTGTVPATLTELDRRILAALAVHGRASWAHVARALGAAESTVARRAQRLIDDRLVHVVGLADPMRCGLGQSHWVYLRCRPGQAATVARGLAERRDARLVVRLSGSYDIVTELIVPTTRELARVLDDEIGQLPGVTATTTETVLRNFKLDWGWAAQVLGDDVAARLRPAASATPDTNEVLELDALDHALLADLTADGRRGNVDLAERHRVSESMVSRRINRLIERRALAFAPQIDPALLGFGLEAFVRLRVRLGEIEAVAASLCGHAPVRYVSVTTGTSDVSCEVVLADIDALYRFLAETLAALPGINSVETSVVLDTHKRAYQRRDV